MTDCEETMGFIRGREMQALVEESTGKPCPCTEGDGCPLDDTCPISAVSPRSRPPE